MFQLYCTLYTCKSLLLAYVCIILVCMYMTLYYIISWTYFCLRAALAFCSHSCEVVSRDFTLLTTSSTAVYTRVKQNTCALEHTPTCRSKAPPPPLKVIGVHYDDVISSYHQKLGHYGLVISFVYANAPTVSCTKGAVSCPSWEVSVCISK